MISGEMMMTKNTGQELYKKARTLIPGGTQLLSKRPEMFAPGVWPAYYSKASGCRVWDLDGNEYIDMSIMGIGANILGYADPDVDQAVMKAIRDGSNSSLNCAEEVQLAEVLIELHPWAQMVRYTRSGGEAMAMAIRIARAATGRDKVLFSGYHGWMDWYLAANLGEVDALDGQLMPGLEPHGVPRGLQGTAIPFSFDDIGNLRAQTTPYSDQIAAIVVEPARGEEVPKDNMLELRAIASKLGAVLIFDEITSGFRMCAGGIHLNYGIDPDMAVFAKSIANGYAMAAVIGREEVMEAAQSSFISSTNWTERIGPAAALATIRKYIQKDVSTHIKEVGNRVKNIWYAAAEEHDLPVHVSGLPSLCHLAFEHQELNKVNTYYTVRMLDLGFLGYRQFKPALAHEEKEIALYDEAVSKVFSEIARHDGDPPLSTPAAHAGFYRLTKE